MKEMSVGRVFLISGIPGAGKTTVSRALAERFPRAAHIEGDLVQHHFTVSGGVWPDGEPVDEARRQLALRARNVSLLADSFFEAGFKPVVDDVVVTRNRLDQYQRAIQSRPLVFVVLAPQLEVALHRDEHRGFKRVGHTWAHLDAELRAELTGVGLWLDTGAMGAEETVDTIVERWEEGSI